MSTALAKCAKGLPCRQRGFSVQAGQNRQELEEPLVCPEESAIAVLQVERGPLFFFSSFPQPSFLCVGSKRDDGDGAD